MQVRAVLKPPIIPIGPGSLVSAWQVQADEGGPPFVRWDCHVALELGMPKRETSHTTGLVRREVNHADGAILGVDELCCT